MSDTEEQGPPPPTAVPPERPSRRQARRRWRGPTIFSLWFPLFIILCLTAIAVLALTLTQRAVPMPDWVTHNIEERLNAKLANQAKVKLGGVEISMIDGIAPTVHLRNVSISDRGGNELAQLAELTADFDLDALMNGTIDTRNLSLRGAEITLLRRIDGTFAVAFGQSERARGDLAAILDQLDQIFTTGPLAAVDRMTLVDLTVTLEDARVNRIWQATSGRLDLVQTADDVDAGLNFDVFNGTEQLTPVQIALHAVKGSPEASLTATFRHALAADIAAQSPGLTFLSLLDAPIDGRIAVEIGSDSKIKTFGGEIEIGAGSFAPATGGGETMIRSGAAAFSFDPAAGRVDFSKLALATEQFNLDLRGHTLIDAAKPGGWPNALVAQMQVVDATFNNPALVSEPVHLTEGNADFRLTFAPFRVDIGQLRLSDGETAVTAHGTASAPPTEGGPWQYRISAALDSISTERLGRYWPLPVAPKARDWYLSNVLAGTIFDVDFAIMSDGGAARRLLSWRMRDATVRYMETMPLLTGAKGYGTLEGNRFSVTAEGGTVSAGETGVIEVAGTTMLIEDTRIRPTPAIFDLATRGDLAAALLIINNKPLSVMDKAGQPVDLASGQVAAQTHVETVLAKGVPLGDISWQTSARMSDVTVPRLVPTGTLTSDDLSLTANPENITISGPMMLDDVPLDATFTQGLGPGADGVSKVDGTVTLGPEFVREFSIGLPKNAVSGAGPGDFSLRIAKGQDIRFTLDSALAGLGLRLDALNWAKSAKTTGALSVKGRIAAQPVIDELAFDAAGLQAKGTLTVAANGGLDRAEFNAVKIGGWFNGPVTLTGRGRNATPGIEVKGGSLDFRRADFGSGAASDGGPLKVSLDRLTIADSIVMQGFRGNFTSLASGLRGNFTGRLNGGGVLEGALAPSENGTALVVTSDNAGEVFKDANLAQRVKGGAMELVLTPTGETGTYNGKMTAKSVSVRGTPALAELLSAISVIGLLQQLNGDGITFDSMEAQFTLTPSFIQFRKASAVGPAMGIAMDGAYTLATGALNMRGTIAPIYFVNGVGQIFSRKGGGLFSFDFKLKGTSENPQVQVNPLSILAPGMFKELFRRPPPKPVE